MAMDVTRCRCVVLAERETARASRGALTRNDVQVEPHSLTRKLDLLQDQLARSDDPAPTHRILYRTRPRRRRGAARVESALAAQLDASEAADGGERKVSFHAMDRVVRDDFTNSQSGRAFYLLNPALLTGRRYRYAVSRPERGDSAEARDASGYLWLDVAAAGALPLASARGGADEAAMTVRVHRAATRYWSPRGPLLLYEPSPWGLGFTVSAGGESASRDRAPAIRVHFICQTVCDGGADAALWDWLLPDAARAWPAEASWFPGVRRRSSTPRCFFSACTARWDTALMTPRMVRFSDVLTETGGSTHLNCIAGWQPPSKQMRTPRKRNRPRASIYGRSRDCILCASSARTRRASSARTRPYLDPLP